MPSTRTERLQEKADVTNDILSLLFGTLRKLFEVDPSAQMYMSMAGDDPVEQRRRVGIYSAALEHVIEEQEEWAKSRITRCLIRAMKSHSQEERDNWHERARKFGEFIKRLKSAKTYVLKILVMEIPWPEIIQAALTTSAERGNITQIPASLRRALDALQVKDIKSLPPPPAPGDSEPSKDEESESGGPDKAEKSEETEVSAVATDSSV